MEIHGLRGRAEGLGGPGLRVQAPRSRLSGLGTGYMWWGGLGGRILTFGSCRSRSGRKAAFIWDKGSVYQILTRSHPRDLSNPSTRS